MKKVRESFRIYALKKCFVMNFRINDQDKIISLCINDIGAYIWRCHIRSQVHGHIMSITDNRMIMEGKGQLLQT